MKKLIIIALSALSLVGCTHIAREKALDQRPMSAALEPQDVRRTVDKMVDSMLADQVFINEVGGSRPILDVATIQNRSTMHLDTISITDSIRSKLIKSRRFRFMDRSTQTEDLGFLNDQANAGLTDPAKAIQKGQQSAAQMYLYGALSEMRQTVGDVTDRYYKFTLNLKDLKSGEILWSDEQEIRKEQIRPVFGY